MSCTPLSTSLPSTSSSSTTTRPTTKTTVTPHNYLLNKQYFKIVKYSFIFITFLVFIIIAFFFLMNSVANTGLTASSTPSTSAAPPPSTSTRPSTTMKEHDPNLTAGRPDELLILIPHMSDVSKVKSWLIQTHQATILYESNFEPVYLHIRVPVEHARVLLDEKSSERVAVTALAEGLIIEPNNQVHIMSPM